jgi:predicted DNA-binding protein YlxM (UPF0122 family)
MKKMTVVELAKLYGISRQAVYAHINKGNLSKGSDGLIDFSEAIRALGEPQSRQGNDNVSQSIDSSKLSEFDSLKMQVDLLEKQLNQALKREDQALEREGFYQHQIETMQRLLETPKPQKIDKSDQGDEPTITPKQEEILEEKKVYPVPEIKAEEPRQRGFWSKFFLPNG